MSNKAASRALLFPSEAKEGPYREWLRYPGEDLALFFKPWPGVKKAKAKAKNVGRLKRTSKGLVFVKGR